MLEKIENWLVGEMDGYERAFLRHAACWFFLILLSYYAVRPIRESIGSKYEKENLSNLFWATFIVMLVAIPIYSWLVGKFDRRKLVPTVYAVFVGSLLVLWAAMTMLAEDYQLPVAQCFFVWVSVFGLFVVSFFWSVAGDLLSSNQSKRIFGVVMGSGTIGGLIGSQLTAQLVPVIGVANLLLIPAVVLVFGLGVYFLLERACQKRSGGVAVVATSGKATGGNPFAGFTAVFKSTYLIGLFLFALLMSVCGTAVYFQQSEIVKSAYANAPVDEELIRPRALEYARAEQRSVTDSDIARAASQLQVEATDIASTAFFANVNTAVSVLAMMAQFFLASRLMRWFGVGWSLAVLPMIYVLGLVLLSFSPTLAVVAIAATIGRAAEYGICNPAREVLYTAIAREERYKAKSFIDTVVRRGGDSACGSIYRGLRGPSGFEMPQVSWMAVPFAIAWAILSVWIGRENRRITETSDQR